MIRVTLDEILSRLDGILDECLAFSGDERRPGKAPAAPVSDGVRLARVSMFLNTLMFDLNAERAEMEVGTKPGNPGQAGYEG